MPKASVTQIILPGSGEHIPTLEAYCARCAGQVSGFAERFYVFNHGADFTADDVEGFQGLGLQVIVSINRGHYQTGDPRQQGESHVRRMLDFGVDGVQVDSCYDKSLFET